MHLINQKTTTKKQTKLPPKSCTIHHALIHYVLIHQVLNRVVYEIYRVILCGQCHFHGTGECGGWWNGQPVGKVFNYSTWTARDYPDQRLPGQKRVIERPICQDGLTCPVTFLLSDLEIYSNQCTSCVNAHLGFSRSELNCSV